MQPIKDDVSVVVPAINKARATFNSGKTKNIQYRIAQLNALKKGMQTMSKDLTDAVKADIGRESFVTWFSELSILEKEINHALAHIQKWS